MAKGGGSSQTTVQKSEPWKEQVPYLKEIFNEARALYRSNKPSYFPKSTVAPLSAETEAALAMQAARARAGSALTAPAREQVQAVLRGDYLNAGNPAFAAMAQRVADEVTPRVNSQFAAAGRYGSGAHAATLGRALADEIGALAYRNYADERANQLKAAALAPQLARADYADIDRLAAVGARRDELAQALLNDEVARFNFAQALPFDKLAQYQDFITGSYGGTRTLTQPYTRGGSVLSGLQTGAAVGSAINSPWGTVIGAGLGGLLAGFL
ncbi:MAG: hypothetical protein IRY94_14200 [Rhodospirillaceae bacterium]|nr:hypothetical protein [Rhodospirillaceae bacterium]